MWLIMFGSKKLLLLSATIFFISNQPAEGRYDRGHMSLDGSINSSPCTIETEDMRQTLDFGVISINQLREGKASRSYPFTIRLRNCVYSEREKTISPKMEMRFSGKNDGRHFSVDGTAQGFSLLISDMKGNPILPNQRHDAFWSNDQDAMNMNYTVTLVGNGEKLKLGDFQSKIALQIVYF